MVVASATEQIDQLIESRTASRVKANAQAAAWSASERRYHERRRRENRAAWYDFYCRGGVSGLLEGGAPPRGMPSLNALHFRP